MNWKEFLKPTLGKIITIILIIILFILFNALMNIDNLAFPLPLYKYTAATPLGSEISILGLIKQINIIGIVINLVIWYSLSCLIIFIYNKVKGR